ncbi:MAG: DUF805 domain-containing protein [Pseudomonadota bacterium]
MLELFSYLNPAGRTSRKVYCGVLFSTWIFLILFFLATKGAFGSVSSILIVISAGAILFLLTCRRLRDAGLSPWLALLAFFPFGITIDPGLIAIEGIKIKAVDIGDILRGVPTILAIFVPTRESQVRQPATDGFVAEAI